MRIQRFGHAGIEVGDLEAAEGFYRELFGFEVAARFPDDGEVMFSVGKGDHLLLHSAAADANVHGAAPSRGLNHAAFQLEEGHREIRAARGRLQAMGIAFEALDHDGEGSLYFRDPDGNLLEVYSAAGSTPHFSTADERRKAARRFVYAAARPVDRAIYRCRWEHGGAAAVEHALLACRNDDGGFGHALEPDVRAPGSQPIHTLTALELLREAGLRSPDVADGCCEFLSGVATEEGAVPALVEGALDFPAAAHWQGAFAQQPSISWTFGLAAQLVWHGARHPWARQAAGVCRAAVADAVTDEAHHLLYLVRFAGDVLEGAERQRLLERCRTALDASGLFVAETPVRGYGLTPLHYAPAPDAPMRPCFDDALIEAHLDDLLDAQQGDGGWPIRFDPPSPAAFWEWRGRWTLEALAVLEAWGRL